MATLEAPRSTPDLQKLSGMGSRTLNITKLTSRSGAGLSVITGKKNVSVEEITNLHTLLPNLPGAGPGTYKFEVFDETGPEKDTWTTRLGPDISPEAPNMAIDFTGGAGAGIPGAGAPGSARFIGNGYYYDDALQLLITPGKQAIPWKPGEPFPGTVPAAAAAAASPWGPAASPLPPWMQMPGAWPGSGWGAVPGWGSMPATGGSEDETKREIRELKAQLEERNREDAHKAEMTALREEMRASNAALTAALGKLTEAPRGPSPEVEALKTQLAATEKRFSDETARNEAARREDTIRAEIKANADRADASTRELRDALKDRPDPMAPLITQMLSSQQAASSAALAAVSSATEAAADASKESMRMMTERFGTSLLTPERMESILKLAKDNGPNDLMNQGVLNMYKTLFGMSQDVLRQQAEIYNSAGGPAWVGPVQQGLEQVGKIAQAYAARKAESETEAEIAAAREAKKAEVDEARRRNEEARVARANAEAQANARRRAAAATAGNPAAAAAAAAAASGRPLTADEERELAAQQVFRGADRTAASPKNGAGNGASNGAGKPAAAAAAAPAAAAPPKRRNRAADAPVAPAAPAAVAADYIPPGGEEPEDNVVAMHPAPDISKLPTEALRGIVDAMNDEEFFGPFESQVKKLRSAAMPPDEAANAVLASRSYFAGYGEVLPAIELLQAGHIDLLCERLFPASPQPYRAAVADSIRVQLAAEAAEGADGADATA